MSLGRGACQTQDARTLPMVAVRVSVLRPSEDRTQAGSLRLEFGHMGGASGERIARVFSGGSRCDHRCVGGGRLGVGETHGFVDHLPS